VSKYRPDVPNGGRIAITELLDAGSARRRRARQPGVARMERDSCAAAAGRVRVARERGRLPAEHIITTEDRP